MSEQFNLEDKIIVADSYKQVCNSCGSVKKFIILTEHTKEINIRNGVPSITIPIKEFTRFQNFLDQVKLNFQA